MTQTTITATEKQATFIEALLEAREGYTEGFAERVRNDLADGVLPKAKASEIIGWLLERPRKTGAPPAAAAASKPHKFAVPAGHYAVSMSGSKESLSFFRVDTPTEGKWAGYTFVKHIVGGHPDFSVKGEARHATLEAIADAGIVASAQAYAREFCRCLHCNTQLTDETSRAIGIGPHCRKVYADTALIAAVMAS